MDTGDAGPCERGEHANLHAGDIRALQAVHASTHPAERDPEEETGLLADLMADEAADTPPPDKREKNGYD